MAKFTPGPAVAEVRGSVGGTTFSRGRYGQIMRFRAKPVVSVTDRALAAKARMTTCTQGWQAETAADRLAWDQWANGNPITGSLGESQILTGHAAYCGINCRRLIIGGAVLSTPPLTPPPTPLVSMSIAPDGTLDTCDITFAPTPTAAAEQLWITATQQSSAGKHWVENLLKGDIRSPGAQVSPFDAYTVIAARIGDLVIGDYLHVKVFVNDMATGLLSAPLRATAIIV